MTKDANQAIHTHSCAARRHQMHNNCTDYWLKCQHCW